MPARRPLPNLFHRVFLSHLLVLLLSFVVALVLLDYLFVDGISHFLLRSPVILVPVLLAMIGVVGLLAIWTAGAAAAPLERAVDALQEHDSAEALGRLLPRARIDEIAAVIEAMQRRLGRTPASRPLYLRLDRHGNVRGCDVDTAARLGGTPDELLRRNLRDLLADPAEAAAWLASAGDANPDANLRRFRGPAGRILPADCRLHPLPGDEVLLIGIPGPLS